MRTTLDIDDDVLDAAKELARAEGKTMGEVISDLARRALTQPSYGGLADGPAHSDTGGFPTLPVTGPGSIVTTDMVRRLQDESDLGEATPWDHDRDAPRTTKRRSATS
jgi:hypothetical protein